MSYVPQDGSKNCRRCGDHKHVTEFRVFRVYGSTDREYRRSWCKDCERAYSRSWRAKNPGYHAEWSRAYRSMKV
jgi:hypothetical protein